MIVQGSAPPHTCKYRLGGSGAPRTFLSIWVVGSFDAFHMVVGFAYVYIYMCMYIHTYKKSMYIYICI